MKKKQEENLSLFSNLEEYRTEKQENEEAEESVKEKENSEKAVEKTEKEKTSTLFTILNGKKVDLTIEEIFDDKRFSCLKAVTYSVDGNFVNKYLSNFEKVELIVGIPDKDVQQRAFKAARNIISGMVDNIVDYNDKTLRREQIKTLENLSARNQEKIGKRMWRIKSPLKFSIHSKFYLLESANEKRLIIGSANLSNQAFSSTTVQFENIMIFDNDEIYEDYSKYFNILFESCTDYITSSLKDELNKRIKIVNKNKEKNEKAIPVFLNFDTNKQTQGILIDFFEDALVKKNELSKEEQENLSKTIKNLPNELEILKKEKENDEDYEELKCEIIKKYITPNAKITENLFVKPDTFKKKIQKIEVRVAPKIKENVLEREIVAYRENEVDDNSSGLFISENGTTTKIGRKATKEEIKKSIEVICKLIDNYRKYTSGYNETYGSRVLEAIFYSFTSPFVPKIRQLFSENDNEVDIPLFMFLGGQAQSGKTLLTKLIMKMMGYSVNSLMIYNYIIPDGRNQKSDTIKQLKNWMTEDNVSPLFIDEIVEDFFKNNTRGNELITDVANITSRKKGGCCLIGTTNSDIFSLPERAARRCYYITNDKVFDENLKLKSENDYNKVSNEINSLLFQDFSIKLSNRLMDENALSDFQKNRKEDGKADFLYWTREIFKEYFLIAGIEIPEWFPQERYSDVKEQNMVNWQMLYEAYPEKFIPKTDTEEPYYLFDLMQLNSGMHTKGYYDTRKPESEIYFDALDSKLCLKKTKKMVKIKIKEFHEWIGVPIPEEILKKIDKTIENEIVAKPEKKKRNFFDFFKRNKKHKQD